MANEKRLIDANPIVRFIMDGLNNPDKMKALGHDAIEVLAEIEFAPTVDAVEVVHGRWIYVDGKGTNAEYECNKCHMHVCFDEKIDGSIPAYKHCPNCGAKMDGGNEDG